LYRRVWNSSDAVLAADHPDKLNSGLYLAGALRNLKRAAEGAIICREAVEVLRRSNRESLGHGLWALGMICRDMDRPDDAIQHFMECIWFCGTSTGQKHEWSQAALADLRTLAVTFAKKNDRAVSIAIRKQIYETFVDLHGENNYSTLHNLAALAKEYGEAGDWKQAYECRAWELASRREPGVQDEPPLYCLEGIGNALAHLNRFEEAEEHMRECVRLTMSPNGKQLAGKEFLPKF
jgi:tetratricopeptide (TPR) repeat protein